MGDLCTKEIANLTVEDIKQVCDQSIDVAKGLGEKVTVMGLSMGGVMSAYNAQFRDDIEQAVQYFENYKVVRKDEIEPLPDDFKGFWISSPSKITDV